MKTTAFLLFLMTSALAAQERTVRGVMQPRPGAPALQPRREDRGETLEEVERALSELGLPVERHPEATNRHFTR